MFARIFCVFFCGFKGINGRTTLSRQVIRQEKLALARKRLVEMRISKNRARDIILELKQKRARLWNVLKGEEQRYSDAETARRRLEEQHSSISRLSRVANTPISTDGGTHRMSAANATAVIRRHELLERALEDANAAVPTFQQASESLSLLI